MITMALTILKILMMRDNDNDDDSDDGDDWC